MTVIRTARERARAEIVREITDAARRQLALDGAQRLSLRAVARELDLASSAVYRYFPSRDALLTALIVQAYDALGAAAEEADRSAGQPGGPGALRGRWRAVCSAVRGWARGNAHEYALLYGTPVPDYAAPADTLGSAARVPLVLLGLVREAAAAGEPAPAGRELDPVLSEQARAVSDALGLDLPEPGVVAAVRAWTSLFGAVSFELFGHLVGSMDPADAYFAHLVEELADAVGLPAA